jgi:hypothetical protein
MSTNLLNLKLFWRLPAASSAPKHSSVIVAIQGLGGLILRTGASPPIFHGSSMSALSPMHSLTNDQYDERLVAGAAHCAGWRHIGLFSIAGRKAGHGNDRVWKAWKAIIPASHPSHTLWKSLRDSHIPTPRRLVICLLVPLQLETSPPQGACNGCLRSTA